MAGKRKANMEFVAPRFGHRGPSKRSPHSRFIVAFCALLFCVQGLAWGAWLATSAAAAIGPVDATTVNQGAIPNANAVGSQVTLDWAATTTANGLTVSGYRIKRYAASDLSLQTILSSCTGTVAATTCVESNVPDGSWKYTVTPVIGTNWLGAESGKSVTVVVDGVAPTNAITLSSVIGGAVLSGTNVYYRGSAAGSLRLTNAVTDANSGPASSQTSALTGTSTGWTNTGSTVTTPAGGPFVSSTFTWAAATTTGPGVVVTGRDVAANTATTSLNFVNDSANPTAGTITYTNGYTAGLSASIVFTTGTDAGSGIATRQLQRASALLSGGVCGSFGTFGNIGADSPTSPYVDNSVGSNACYKYRYVVTDKVGNQDTATGASVVMVDYASTVNATAGLLSHWRLGESAAGLTSFDSFTSATGVTLQSRSGETGAGWAKNTGASGADAVITGGDRIRKSGASTNGLYYSTTVPSNANYRVEADLYVASAVTDDVIGVVGRESTSAATFYAAIYDQATQRWSINVVNPTPSSLGASTVQPLTVGSTYRVALDMNGSTIRLLVNGVQQLSVTNASISAAGRSGVVMGDGATTTTLSDTTGMHLDNFQVSASTYPRAADNKGSNIGDYKNGVTLGVTGALAASSNTAAQFDGVNDYVQMNGTTGIPVGSSSRSVEMWFKTSSAARQVLFSYGSRANTQEFGLWLDAGGATMSAWGFGGGNDKTFTPSSALNDGDWHQVVQTYNGTSLTIYIDGVALPSQLATRATAMDDYGFGIGAVINPLDSNSGGFFNGSLDEVSFYTTVMSQATVTDHFQLGTAPAPDVAGPTGGSVDASGLVGTGSRYANSTTLSLALAKGTDPSGLASTGAQLMRASAALTNGTCGAFGSYALVTGGTDPASPKSDTVTDQACYSYQYVVADTIGNSTTYTSPDIKVDLTAPAAPSLGFSAFTNTYWTGTGSTVYYRSAASSGSFTATSTATDSVSGIASHSFPSLGTNWTSTPGALGVNTYSWTAGPQAPGSKSVTATNNAAGVSPGTSFTLTADDTAPSAGTLSYSGGTQTTKPVNLTFTTGTDAGSGIGTRLLQRASATWSGTTCGAYGAFATVSGGTNPTSPFTDSANRGNCYKYQYVVSDNVGNTNTATSASVVQVGSAYAGTIAAESTLVNYWRLGEATGSTTADSKGTAGGTFFNAPTLGVTGAIAGDSNTAVTFNGVDEYVSAARVVADNFSLEFWFKSTQGIGTSPLWSQGAGLVDANTSGNNNDFGVSLRSDGVVVAGVGSAAPAADVSILSPTGGYDDGNWHQVVFTRTKASGVFTLYLDGASAATGTWNTASLNTTTNFNFGRLQNAINYYAGSLDEVATYNVALTPAAIQAHYDAAQP